MSISGSDNFLYDFPPGTSCFADLADRMTFNRASIIKSGLRWGEKDGTTLRYDLEKIIWYANRELRKLSAMENSQSHAARRKGEIPGTIQSVGVRGLSEEETT